VTERVERLGPGDVDSVIDVLADAFRDYPVMRYVLGPDGDPRTLATLIRFFVRARVVRGDAVFGARDPNGALVGVATTTAPGDRPAPPEFEAERAAAWAALGADARARYEAFGAAVAGNHPAEPHLYLNMLGVRRAHAGRGTGRLLLDAVHAHSRGLADSRGVALSTENPSNVPLYEHVGYRQIGHVRVTPELETWGMWRPDEPSS
jgi:GNAT superfamily N-acetyltransferase